MVRDASALGDRRPTSPTRARRDRSTALTARAPDDPDHRAARRLGDVADVLTFYQERIANEGYLRTATERRSVLELAREIGYELSPGVAAGTELAFYRSRPRLGAPQSEPCRWAPGCRASRDPDETPADVRDVEAIDARARSGTSCCRVGPIRS